MSYEQLGEQERYVIAHMRMAGFALRAIGERIGRHHTTVSRELRRNAPDYGGPYWYDNAHPQAVRDCASDGWFDGVRGRGGRRAD